VKSLRAPALGDPLVSVVMAVRDGAPHLRQSISSILAQDLTDFEFVVVDDGSRDASSDILTAFAAADPRVRVIRMERPVGLPSALNVALDAARGTFIARHDDDDVAQPWRLRVQTDFMARHPHFTICGGLARMIDRHGTIGGLAARPLGESAVLHMLGTAGRNAVIHSSILMRSACGLRYRERFVYAQDYDLLLLAVSSGLRIFNLPHVLLHLRVHAGRQTAAKQFRQIMYRRAAHRFYEERLKTGADSYDTHDFSGCEPRRLDDLVDPEQVATAARLQLSAFVSGSATRGEAWRAALRAVRRGSSPAMAAGMAAITLAPQPLLSAARRFRQSLTGARPPRCSTAVIASLGGGVATWRATGTVSRELRVYEELCRRGLPVTLYTFDRPADVRDVDTPVRIVPGPLFRLPGRLCAAYALSWAITRCSSGRRHTVLITNQAHSGWPAIVLGRAWAVPVIARCGYVFSEQAATMGWHDRRSRRRAAWEAWTHRHATASFLPTDDLIAWCRSHMPGFDPRRAFRVPNFIDTHLFAPQPETNVATDVLAVGRLHPEKRLSLLLAAAATIPGLRLTIVGDGSDRSSLEAEAARLGVTVRFISRVPNQELPAVYRGCAVFAIASVREGNPKALLEAMACGCASIGTDSPGIRNVIRHGVNGLLCGATPLEVATAIRGVLADHALRDRLGAAARELVVGENSLPRILAIYEDAIVSLATGERLWPVCSANGAAA
jgi:glycosyltransferase involved in cell wall biosynthesis/GT2 family glycosyltransferase